MNAISRATIVVSLILLAPLFWGVITDLIPPLWAQTANWTGMYHMAGDGLLVRYAVILMVLLAGGQMALAMAHERTLILFLAMLAPVWGLAVNTGKEIYSIHLTSAATAQSATILLLMGFVAILLLDFELSRSKSAPEGWFRHRCWLISSAALMLVIGTIA
jgi:predicted neutral ceramidase superfamily lipid hydrolase